jgi:hypothetical protein
MVGREQGVEDAAGVIGHEMGLGCRKSDGLTTDGLTKATS